MSKRHEKDDDDERDDEDEEEEVKVDDDDNVDWDSRRRCLESPVCFFLNVSSFLFY